MLTGEQKEYLLALIEDKKKSLTEQHGKENSEQYKMRVSELDRLASEIKNGEVT